MRPGTNGNGRPHEDPWRIALYSHDTMGIGHVRRNLLIAQSLASYRRGMSILLLAGAREAGAFATPPGVDCLTLPSLYKEKAGVYQARNLDLAVEDLVDLRRQTIRAALEAFAPDVFIVDKVPRGALGELDRTLEHLRARGHTKCVLGLREVLDDPVTVEREWRAMENEEAIRAYYESVWVYGDPAVYDPVREYHFSPAVASKARYTGYLDQRMRLDLEPRRNCADLIELGIPPGPFVLCMLGGGQDGAALAEAFTQAELPGRMNGVVLTGPFMPSEARERLHQRASGNPRLRVLEFVAEPDLLLNRADRVVAMGGYNSVLEILSFEKHALIVPRVRPRREQYIRAERLRDLGLLDILHPDEVTPATLAAWLARDLPTLPPVRQLVDLRGLIRLPHLLEDCLNGIRQSPAGQAEQCRGSDLCSRLNRERLVVSPVPLGERVRR